MQTLKLLLSYDGTGYCGWQTQKIGRSIQQELTEAIEKVTGSATAPVASGRTDAGVHALGQVAHLLTRSTLAPGVLVRAINAHLPEQIVVHEAVPVDASFHAVRDAKWKHYRYVIHDGPHRDPFLRGYCWKIHRRQEVEKMQQAAARLVGTHDFRSFETDWPTRASSVRTVRRCDVARLGDVVYLDVEANGFLYNMARTIAGTLSDVGRGKCAVSKVDELLGGAGRTQAGPTAPACGLFLIRVEY